MSQVALPQSARILPEDVGSIDALGTFTRGGLLWARLVVLPNLVVVAGWRTSRRWKRRRMAEMRVYEVVGHGCGRAGPDDRG